MMKGRSAKALSPNSAGGGPAGVVSRKEVGTARTLTVVRCVLVAWAAIDLVGVLMPPLAENSITENTILGLSWVIVLFCTYRVTWAALAGAVLIVVSALTGDLEPVINMFIFVPVAVCAFSPWRVVSAVVCGYLLIGLAGQVYNGENAMASLVVLILLSGSSFIGLVVRLLVARSRWAGKQIRSLEDAASELRESERRALAGELTGLLSKELSDQRECLENARGETKPEALTQLLEGTARGARAALSQLRGLVQALRGREGESLPVEPDVDLVEAVENVDDLLTGHGFWVEIDTSRISRPPSATASRLLGEFVRAAGACVLAYAQPGDQCELSVSSDDGETRVRCVSASVRDSHDLSQARQRIEAMGGSVRTISGGGVSASMPVNPMDDGGAGLEGRCAWNLDALVRVVLTVILVAAIPAVAASSSLHQSYISGILWGVFLAGLALCLWWPLCGGILVAVVFAAGTWALEPVVLIGVSNLPFVILVAMVTVYRPRWVWLLVLVGAARFWLWFGEFNVDLGLVTIVYGGIGILAGMAARYFLQLRARQYTELSDATVERERARSRVRHELAGELHDIVAHQLTLLSLNVDAHRGESDSLVLRGALDRADAILASAQADLAFLLYILRTSGDETPEEGLGGPGAAVAAAVSTLRTSGRNVEVTFDSAVDDVDPTTSRTLTRVVREASTNILRYAPARARCVISVERDAERICVTVRSELAEKAAGAEAQLDRAADSTGLGLVGLAERLRLTGGSLRAGQESDEWVVKAQLPIVTA